VFTPVAWFVCLSLKITVFKNNCGWMLMKVFRRTRNILGVICMLIYDPGILLLLRLFAVCKLVVLGVRTIMPMILVANLISIHVVCIIYQSNKPN